MTTLFYDIIGWLGVALLLVAYALLSLGRLPGDSRRFQAMNMLGALLLAANAWHYNTLPSVVVNVAWALIGLVALLRRFRAAP